MFPAVGKISAVPCRDASMSDLAFLAETLVAQYFEVCSDYRVKREVRNVRRFR